MNVSRYIYLDNNATTPLHPEVKKAIVQAMECYGNASSFHTPGREARKIIEEARENIAQFIGASPDEIIFLGSGSEANNTVLNIASCSSCGCTHKQITDKSIATSSIEHPCVLETARCMSDKGKNVIYLKVDEFGKVDMKQLEELISTDHVGLVSVMMANNEMGTVQDIKTITKIVRSYGILMHTDAVQALGKIPVNVKDLDVDFLSLSAHKIYGPKGVGVLYVRKGTPFCPFIRGGHQEKGRRAGTENTLGIIGFSKAVEMLRKEMDNSVHYYQFLKDKLKSGIMQAIPRIKFNGHPRESLPNTLNVSFEGAEGESILLYLDLEGIAVSTGSACSSGSLEPSHVLLAMGVSAERAHGSIRFSFGRENTEEDVDYVLEKLPKVIERIRKMSTAYTGNI